DLTRVTASIAAFYRHVAQGPVLPQLDWHVAEDEEGNFVLAVAQTPQTVRASLWVAAGPTRDVPQASWLEVQPREEDGDWAARPVPRRLYGRRGGHRRRADRDAEHAHLHPRSAAVAGRAPQ